MAQKVDRKGCRTYQSRITLTFKNNLTSDEGLYILCCKLLRQKTFTDYVFYPEYGKNHNFHVHGTIWYTNKLHYSAFINIWRHHIGFIYESNKTVEEQSDVRWHLYCRKDQWIWNQYRINKSNIQYRFKKLAIKLA